MSSQMKKISRRQMLRGIALTAGATILGACNTPPTTTVQPATTQPAQKKAVTLKLALFGTADYVKSWEAMIKVYTDQNPGVTIEIISAPNDQYYQKVQVMLAGGQPLDVMIVEDKMVRFFASNGVIMPIDEYITAADKDTFFAATLGPFQYQGKTYGLPRRVNNTAVYYNKAMFAKEGIKIPTGGWTQEEFFAAARTLTKKDSGGKTSVYGVDFRTDLAPSTIVPWVWSNGGEIFNQDITKCVMTMPETVSTFQSLVNLIKEGVMPTTDVRESMETSAAMFSSQKVAMLGSYGCWLVPTFRKINDFEWDVLPLPSGKKGRVNIVYASCFAIASQTKNRDEAIKFVKFSTGPVAQTEESKNPTAIPSIKSVAEAPIFLDPNQPPAHMKQFLAELEGSRPAADVYHPMKFLETMQAATEEFDLMWRGKREAAAALKAAEDRINKLIA